MAENQQYPPWLVYPERAGKSRQELLRTHELANDIALGSTYIDELFSADIIIIGVPMYNFSLPSQLKAWLDRVLVAGRTFHYTANGPEGLLPAGKKVYIASTRGGVYSGTSPVAHLDHQETLLTAALNFIGLSDITIFRAEGLALGDDARATALARAKNEVETTVI
ncbi:TPA: NAD(P)H-dependent oxidoreductase [Klebsiella michiganensis]|nr:NAD(P)H-dependent oxidoreductase [Klebsiella michiganensis]